MRLGSYCGVYASVVDRLLPPSRWWIPTSEAHLRLELRMRKICPYPSLAKQCNNAGNFRRGWLGTFPKLNVSIATPSQWRLFSRGVPFWSQSNRFTRNIETYMEIIILLVSMAVSTQFLDMIDDRSLNFHMRAVLGIIRPLEHL